MRIFQRIPACIGIALSLISSPVQATESSENLAKTAAVTDTVTTLAVLASGGNESNPLLGTNPAAIVAVGLVKIAFVNYVKDREEYAGKIKILTGLWSIGAVNNILILIGMAGPVALLGGIAGGIIIYNQVKE
jgi:hypothetical protein